MQKRGEKCIKGVAVSRGIAVGKVVTFFGQINPQRNRSIAERDVTTEIARFRSALETAKSRLITHINRYVSVSDSSAASILETQLLILDDPAARDRVEREIEIDLVSAETAVTRVFEAITSGKAMERNKPDIEDAAEKLLAELGEGSPLPIGDLSGAIVAAADLRPSTVTDLIARGAIGFIATNGGWTSHSSILMREAGTPAVVGVDQIRGRFDDGDIVRVNGFTGEIVFGPIESDEPERSASPESSSLSAAGLQTLDGKAITVRANADSIEGWIAAAELGADGVGLFRTETLIGTDRRIPSEDEQTAVYSALANVAGRRTVCIRTFDLTARDVADIEAVPEKNPALGVRGLRMGVVFEEILRTQLRAILRASRSANLRVAVPMISGVADIEIVRRIIAEENARLNAQGIVVPPLPFGVMVEVPSAVMMINEIAQAADFLCLGTNDLVQYLLAADRDNAAVSRWFRSLHPAMIRATKLVIEASVRDSKPLVLCGEMAGSPYYVPVLIGLGATELSMNPGSIQRVVRVVSGIAYEEARDLVRRIDECSTADAVESVLNATIRANWLHLYPEGFLEMQVRN